MKDDWSARMSDAQLHDALSRLREPRGENAGQAPASGAEVALFEAFVQAELARRHGDEAPRGCM
jgi:hypothetical protein